MIDFLILSRYKLRECLKIFKEPQLSFRIGEEYFQNNLRGRESEFTFENGFYRKTIVEDGLEIIMREDDDSKYIRKAANFVENFFGNFEIFLEILKFF